MMGRGQARPGLSTFQRIGRGTAQPITLKKNTARPGPAHHIAMPMKHGLYMGRPGKRVGGPVELTGGPTGRPVCCPVLKSAYAYASVFFLRWWLVFRCFFPIGVPWDSCFFFAAPDIAVVDVGLNFLSPKTKLLNHKSTKTNDPSTISAQGACFDFGRIIVIFATRPKRHIRSITSTHY